MVSTTCSPTVSSAAVNFGDLDPSGVMMQIGQSCIFGCPTGGAFTGYIVPTPTGTLDTVRATGVPMTLSYTIDLNLVKNEAIPTYMSALTDMMSAGSTNSSFYYSPAADIDEEYTTQYSGPSLVALERFTDTVLDGMQLTFSSQSAESDVDCDTLTGAIDNVLSLIPEAPSFFGTFASMVCAAAG